MKKSIIVMVAVMLALVPMMALLPAEPASTDDAILYPSADCTVASAVGVNMNSQPIIIHAANASNRARGEVRFALLGIPTGSTITSAELNMTCYSYTGGGARQYNVYPNTRSWTETGVTWGNKPSFVGSPNASVSIAGTGVASWDVTAIVQDWVDLTLPQWGFVVIDDDELDDSDAFAYFRAREYTGTADDPTLEITYTPPPVTTVSIGDVTILENSWGTVNITIDTTEPMGVGSIWLNVFWDDSVIDLATPSITGTDFDSSSGVVHSGNTTIIAYDLTQVGPGTDLLVATLNFTADAGSSPLDCTDLDIEVLSIYDGTSGDPQLITPDAVNDGEACIGYDWYEGDINDSGGATPAVAVTVADTQMLSQHLRFNIVLVDEPFMAADVDDGNVVDSADIQMIAQFVASIISAFPGGIYIP